MVKKLLDSRANPYAVDSSGNSGLHYAAGYGRKELLEYLLKGRGQCQSAQCSGHDAPGCGHAESTGSNHADFEGSWSAVRAGCLCAGIRSFSG